MKSIDFKSEYIKLAHKILRGLLAEKPEGQTLLDELIGNLAQGGQVSELAAEQPRPEQNIAAAPFPSAGPAAPSAPESESVPQIALQPAYKKCYACGPQPVSKFNPHKTTKDGLHFLCRDCQTAKAKKANTFKEKTEPASSEAPPNLNGHSEAQIHPSTTEGKRCATCTKKGDSSLKPFSEFNRNRRTPDGYSYDCRKCGAAKARGYYDARHSKAAPPPSVALNPSAAVTKSIPPAPAISAPPTRSPSPAPTNGFRRATGTVVAEMETERPLRERMKNAGREVYRAIAQNRSITQGIRSTLAELYDLTTEQVEVVVSEQLAMWTDMAKA